MRARIEAEAWTNPLLGGEGWGATARLAYTFRGIEPNLKRIAEHLESSLMLATALAPKIGYEKAAEIALSAHREGITLREAARKLGYIGEQEFDDAIKQETARVKV